MQTKHALSFLASGAALLLCVTVVYAGSLTPSTSPAATSYTLTDIYTRLTTNATATAGDHDFAPSGAPAASLHTLTEIYGAIPTIEADRVLSGTSLLGVAGTYDIDNLSASVVELGVTFGSGSTGTLEAYIYGDDSAAYVLGTAEGSGTALVDMWNGTSSGGTFPGGSQINGGVDDYNDASSPAIGRYVSPAGWTTCNVGNNYCGTGDTGAAVKDNATGLIWSKTMNGTTYALDDSAGTLTWYRANNCTETTGNICTKKTSSKTGCEATEGWYVPHQKQYIQAMINGAYGNLEAAGVTRDYWSASTLSNNLSLGLDAALGNGFISTTSKTSSIYARCVYPAA